MTTTEKIEKLKEALSDYQKKGFIYGETLCESDNQKKDERDLEGILLEVLKSLDIVDYLSGKLTKREKKTLIKMLMEFGGMDDPSELPIGKAMELGYGTRIQIFIKKLTPRWKRWLRGAINFCISCLIFGLLTKWLLHSFAIGVFTALLFKLASPIFEYVQVAYFQNEILIRQLNSRKKK